MAFDNFVQSSIVNFRDGFARLIAHFVVGAIDAVEIGIKRLRIGHFRQRFTSIILIFLVPIADEQLWQGAFVPSTDLQR